MKKLARNLSVFRSICISQSLFAALPVMAQAAADHTKEVPVYRAKRLLLGCWSYEGPTQLGRKFPNLTMRCFQGGRTLGRVSVESDGGANGFWEHWRVVDQHVVISENYQNDQKCRFAFSKDRQTLTLTDCDYFGNWKRDKRYDKQVGICRKE